MQRKLFFPGDFRLSVIYNSLWLIIALLLLVIFKEPVPILITGVWLIYYLYLIFWIEVTDKSIALRGPFRTTKINWESIKTIRNDYPRLIISQVSIEEEERQRSLLVRGKDMDEDFKDKMFFTIIAKGMTDWPDLVSLLQAKATNAHIDESILRWKVGG